MKRLTVVSGICASCLLGTAMTAVAQGQDKHRNDKNDKQENARPENRQEEARPQEQSRPEDRRHQEPQSGDRRNTTPQSEGRQNQEPQSGDRHPQNRENDRQMQDRQQQRQQEDRQQQGRQQEQPRQGGNETSRAERRGGNQRRIPDSDFQAHFGRAHHFAPGRMQVYNGQPQFYYSGYTFALIQAWPDDWAYDADDYYVDEFDGESWLFNLEHPGVRLELIIVD
jgi:hypothetical protein